MRRFTVPEATETACGVNYFIQSREVDHTQHGFSIYFQPNQHRIKRNTVDERIGAVNRINYPAPPGRAGLLSVLFTENPISGKSLSDTSAQVSLRLAVGDRDQRIVSLALRLK